MASVDRIKHDQSDLQVLISKESPEAQAKIRARANEMESIILAQKTLSDYTMKTRVMLKKLYDAEMLK